MRTHPYVVHFAVALILSSVLLFFVAALFRSRPWAETLRVVARWNLWLGSPLALASIGTGFFDYIDAQCDAATVADTVIHRRSGALTFWSSLIAAVAVYRTQQRAPGPLLLAWLALVGAAAVTVTVLGTQLTYQRALGVPAAWADDAPACFALERGTRQ
jgi:uncharacterized membrane protein